VATYLIKRFLQTLLVLFGVLVMTFTLVHLIPGDPVVVMLGLTATPAELARLRANLGLDQPLPVQFLTYAANSLQGRFGESIFQHQSVLSLILDRMPATVELAAAAMLVAISIGVTTGIISATRPYSWFDSAASVVALAGVAMPAFWFGMLAILLFSLRLGWLPSFGRGESIVNAVSTILTTGNFSTLVDSLRHIILPAFTLGIFSTAIISRLVRSSMLEVLGLDYIRTARAKGLRERVVLTRHALRNALIPVVTVMGLQVGALLGGAVIAETIFAWPGLGRLLITAINQRDYPLVQALVLVVASTISVVNFLVDVLYAWLNPRIGAV
jgi:peptide/nickel transport system permease protein